MWLPWCVVVIITDRATIWGRPYVGIVIWRQV